MPGIGVRTAARIPVDVGDASALPSSGHLGAYASLAPVARASGSSTRGEYSSRRGNKQFKRAFYLAAFASLSQLESRAHYDRKRREGKHHVAAIVALARHRIDVLFAMLRDGTFYQPPTTTTGRRRPSGHLLPGLLRLLGGLLQVGEHVGVEAHPGGVVEGPDRGGVHADQLQVHLTPLRGLRDRALQQGLEDPGVPPLLEADGEGFAEHGLIAPSGGATAATASAPSPAALDNPQDRSHDDRR